MKDKVYRIWDLHLNTWADNNIMLTSNNNIVKIVKKRIRHKIIYVHNDRYAVQFNTGLKDKNLKDIFIGDIIHYNGSNLRVMMNNASYIGYDYMRDRTYTLTSKDMFKYEIVGNIFENN